LRAIGTERDVAAVPPTGTKLHIHRLRVLVVGTRRPIHSPSDQPPAMMLPKVPAAMPECRYRLLF
jgi:hypothetical protein